MTDNEFRPTKGYTFNIDYEQVTGEHTFGISGGTYVWYKTLYEDLLERKTVLATKIHAATALGDAPPFEKFYAIQHQRFRVSRGKHKRCANQCT